MQCLATSNKDYQCNEYKHSTTDFCKIHQYMNSYTKLMIDNSTKCKNCGEWSYLAKKTDICSLCNVRADKEPEFECNVDYLFDKLNVDDPNKVIDSMTEREQTLFCILLSCKKTCIKCDEEKIYLEFNEEGYTTLRDKCKSCREKKIKCNECGKKVKESEFNKENDKCNECLE